MIQSIISSILPMVGAVLCPITLIAAETTTVKRPNILFIAVDDLRPDLRCYGNEQIISPHIDSIARQGLLLNRAYCQQAVCSPSRASIMTGTRPDTTRVWDLVTHFRKALPDVITLPQHFKNAGYFTQGMGKIYHHGFDDPPSWSVPTLYPKAPQGRSIQSRKPGATKAEKRGPAFGKVDVPDDSLHDGELTNMAITALRGMKSKSEPFFLGVGYIRPHLPFISPTKYWDLYDRKNIPLAANPFPPKGAPDYAIVPGPAELRSYLGTPNQRELPEPFAREVIHGYYAAVSYVDAQIGRLLEELDSLGMRENTIIIIWGDHGWKLGEHQAWAKHSNVELDTRVPLIISAPGMKQTGIRSDALVELVDVYPTLAELAGLPLPDHLEGRSFKTLLEKPDQAWKEAVFSQYPRNVGSRKLMGYSMRTDRYRLTRWLNAKDHSQVDAVELYDLQSDPQENTNLADDPAQKDLLEKLTRQWTASWMAQRSHSTATKPKPNPPGFLDFWKMEFTRENPLPPTLADVPYGEDKLQVMDFWKADTQGPAPLVFFIHGGAWNGNDKDRVSGLHAYLDAGISVVSINYRFINAAQQAGVEPPVKWPLLDAARALQFVRSKSAEWNIDPTRIGASGGSAGGCSALWLAFHDDLADPGSSDPVARESTRLSCVGVVGAQTSLDPAQLREWTPNSFYGGHAFGFPDVKGTRPASFNKFLASREKVLPWIREYSPFAWISADDPPVYLFYNDIPALGKNQRDTAHTSNFGVKTDELLRALGVESHFRHAGTTNLKYPDPVAFLIAKLNEGKP